MAGVALGDIEVHSAYTDARRGGKIQQPNNVLDSTKAKNHKENAANECLPAFGDPKVSDESWPAPGSILSYLTVLLNTSPRRKIFCSLIVPKTLHVELL